MLKMLIWKLILCISLLNILFGILNNMDSEGATKAVVKEILGRTGRYKWNIYYQKGSRGGIT